MNTHKVIDPHLPHVEIVCDCSRCLPDLRVEVWVCDSDMSGQVPCQMDHGNNTTHIYNDRRMQPLAIPTTITTKLRGKNQQKSYG